MNRLALEQTEYKARDIVLRFLDGCDRCTQEHYIAVIKNYLNDCLDGNWGTTSWRTREWIDSHSEDEFFEDWTQQFMAIQPMVYPYPKYLETLLISAVLRAGKQTAFGDIGKET